MQKILLIEDNVLVRAFLKELLLNEGYQVSIATDMALGVQKAQLIEPDLILVDISHPKIEDREISPVLRQHEKTHSIPMIMITDPDEDNQQMRELKSKADEIIIRPFDEKELLAKVATFIKKENDDDEMENMTDVLSVLISIIDARDSYTRRHSRRVKNISLRIGEKLSLSTHQLSILKKASELHDIGKIGICDFVLNKKGRLTKEEFESIKEHSTIGERLCTPLKSLSPILKIIRHHHERYDGQGYPDGLKKETIPLEARIIAVADSYDAMSSDRPYRSKLSTQKIKSEFLAGRGSQWDDKIVDCFLDILNSENL
ncbi:MAG: HD domain-containing protein [Deltaproteobacteria bacterium]|nr:HD domain-containing protein [Deltaproteobacteria bacterium]